MIDAIANDAGLPAALTAVVASWEERLAERHGEEAVSAADDRIKRLVAISEFAATTLLREWQRVSDDPERLFQPFDADALARFADAQATSDAPIAEVKTALRQRRNLELLGVLARESEGSASVDASIKALSVIADELLRAAADYAQAQMLERFGWLRDADGEPVPLVVIGMGKLGGGELNFSSDIDVIFAYPRDGESDGRKVLPAQPYFDRLSRQVVSLLDEATADGFVFRTDTRLRPFGDSGPPVVSFAALESYLLQHGRDWERYAYVKARLVGPRPGNEIEQELIGELIRPFVYRRYLDYGVFESLRDMHSMIAAEVERRDRANDVKLGPGGIREIEFLVQSLQLVRGGDRSELKTPSLLRALPLLGDDRGVGADGALELLDAYRYLRRIENFIQAIRDKQTHELPADDVDRARLCVAMGVSGWDALLEELDRHRAVVTKHFDAIAFRGEPAAGRADDDYESLWEAGAATSEWQALLAKRGVADAADVATALTGFQHLPAAQKADATSTARLQTFVPRMLRLVEARPGAAVAVERALSIIEQILRRSAYIALLNENQLAASRLLHLCERSDYIATEIARFPVLLDELLDPRLVTGPLAKADILAEFDDRRTADDDIESQTEQLAQFQRATMFRIAVADFAGELPIMKVSDSLTFLAEAVLDITLRLAWDDLAVRHGEPTYVLDGERLKAGFGIIGYGKLGGLELSYGSDLDIVFLHDSVGDKQVTDGDRPLDNAVFFQRLVRRLVHILGTRTRTGQLYEIDTRLRPSGRKGLLVTSVEAFERYQEEHAWTWEHQALLRARPVAGSDAIGTEFERVRTETLKGRVRRESLRDDVLSMRAKMRAELDRGAAGQFDLKHGEGGVGDIEFLVQYLVLANADAHPAVIEYSDNIRQLDVLAASGIVGAEAASELQDIYRAYRVRQHHIALEDEVDVVDGAEFLPERRRVRELWRQYLEA